MTSTSNGTETATAEPDMGPGPIKEPSFSIRRFRDSNGDWAGKRQYLDVPVASENVTNIELIESDDTPVREAELTDTTTAQLQLAEGRLGEPSVIPAGDYIIRAVSDESTVGEKPITLEPDLTLESVSTSNPTATDGPVTEFLIKLRNDGTLPAFIVDHYARSGVEGFTYTSHEDLDGNLASARADPVRDIEFREWRNVPIFIGEPMAVGTDSEYLRDTETCSTAMQRTAEIRLRTLSNDRYTATIDYTLSDTGSYGCEQASVISVEFAGLKVSE
jgi:hypothetical protein